MKKDPNIYTDLHTLRGLKYKAKGFDFLPLQPVNSLLNGRHVSRLRGRGLNFEEMRHYHIGDDIRSMDWKVTMRTGKPHVKIFSEERERNVYLLVDQRSSMFFGSTEKTKSVIAAELAALIAWRVIETTDRVGAIVFDDNNATSIAPQRSANHVLTLLNEIVRRNHKLKVGEKAECQTNSFAKALTQAQRLVKHDGLVILISDGYGYRDNSEEQIKTLCQRNDLILCHVTDPLEHQLAGLDSMIVSDGQLQVAVSAKDKLRDDFNQDVVRAIEAFKKVAKKYRVPVLPFNTLESSDVQLRRALGAN
ncbi:hypothetical protein JCM19231_4738 [Vibrio ishigakensis]|uniref:DUF58 domain-containing protein n=1 Tax=Vibrio ishigakensis TaxID=1481914 RepID=A0A0B8P7Q0_9VIBR|nr:DUF58 domain-containing protein [Vibrio ishigakensis]GAM59273.1 hypothetical protein JCM19231_4738 [Vibrio ishigakensis]